MKEYKATEDLIRASIAKLASSGMGAAAALRAVEKDKEEEESAAAAAAAAGGAEQESKAKEEADAAGSSSPSSGRPSVYATVSAEPSVLTLLTGIMTGVTSSSSSLSKHKDDFSKYLHLWDTDKAAFMKRYAKANRPLSVFEADIQRFAATESEVRNEIDAAENIFFIRVDHSLLKDALIDHCQQWQRHFTRLLNENARRELEELITKIQETARYLAAPPANLEQLSRNVRLLKEMRTNKASIEGRFGPLEAMYATLAKFEVAVDEGETARLSSIRPAWDEFQSTLDAGEELIKRAKGAMKKDTTDALASFQAEVGDIKGQAREALPYNGDVSVAEAKERIASWRARLAGMRDRERGLAPAMEVFDIPPPEYPQLADVEKDIGELDTVGDTPCCTCGVVAVCLPCASNVVRPPQCGDLSYRSTNLPTMRPPFLACRCGRCSSRGRPTGLAGRQAPSPPLTWGEWKKRPASTGSGSSRCGTSTRGAAGRAWTSA